MIRAVILRYKTSKTDQNSQSYPQIPDLAVGGGVPPILLQPRVPDYL